jgi:uncharacterized protein HemX
MKTRLVALAIVLSLVVLGLGNTSYAKGKTTKKAQTTHVEKKSTTAKTADMQKSDTSKMKGKTQVASAKHHKVHKMAKTSKTTKSHKASTKTSKTSTKSKTETPKSNQ